MRSIWSSVGKWLKEHWKPVWNNELYDERFTKHAEGIKAGLQVLIGFAFAIFLAYQVIKSLDTESLQSTADHALKAVGGALAISAVVELVYTFFTKGPDEATDPLILGISSFALFKLSARKAHLDTASALPLALLALAIVALFFARRFLSGMKNDTPPSATPPSEGEQVAQIEPMESSPHGP
jgi:hypothetical protein